MSSMKLPLGFVYSGVACGIKESQALDLTLITAEQPATAVGVYTQNRICAAPVRVCQERTPTNSLRAVVINSGNANACTGEQGEADARRMTELAAQAVDAPVEDVICMSTGVIGVPLPMDRIAAGVTQAGAELAAGADAFLAAARGILTTDVDIKIASRTVQAKAGEVRIAGMAKGAGMIGPNMATLLSVIVTDAALRIEDAAAMLARVADQSFNAISVEGHTSTNDSLVLVASGRVGDSPLSGADLVSFEAELTSAAIEMAKMIPSDGEGASHLIEIEVTGCARREDARRIAEAVASSNLVKTAVTGNDPNWGRIMSAAGYAGVSFDVSAASLKINDLPVFERGEPLTFDDHEVSQAMAAAHLTRLELSFGEGSGSARFWTSDLTTDYVRFNSDYRT